MEQIKIDGNPTLINPVVVDTKLPSGWIATPLNIDRLASQPVGQHIVSIVLTSSSPPQDVQELLRRIKASGPERVGIIWGGMDKPLPWVFTASPGKMEPDNDWGIAAGTETIQFFKAS